MTPNIADIIRHQVSLEVRCLDRLYLQAYMPKLQTSGGLCYFLHDYLGHPIPSPALLQPRHDAFVKAVEQYAAQHHVPLIAFDPRDRKDEVVAPDRTAFSAREGVVVIGVAQEKARSFKATKRRTPTGSVAGPDQAHADLRGQSAGRKWLHIGCINRRPTPVRRPNHKT